MYRVSYPRAFSGLLKEIIIVANPGVRDRLAEW